MCTELFCWWRAAACSALALGAVVPPVVAAGPAARTAETCTLSGGRIGAVAKVLDGQTVVLDDGTTIRLLSILAPLPADADADVVVWAPAQAAKMALERLIAGRAVSVAGAKAPDRYGRRAAHLMLTDGPEPVWVQQSLVAEGQARVAPAADGDPCASLLVDAEQKARREAVGLWNHPTYRVVEAERTVELLRRRGTFQVVRGTVIGVAEVRGQIYLNFGADWRDDFTAGLSTSLRRQLAQREIEVGRLTGRSLEVRGWIEWRNGPFITLHRPEDLSVLPLATPDPK